MRKIDRTGEIGIMFNGLRATIIEYRHCDDIDVRFENGEYVSNRRYQEFKRGSIRCPLIVKSIEDYARVTNVNINPAVSFLMDAEDLPLLGNNYWCKEASGCISHGAPCTKLHRIIMRAKPDEVVDHINHDPTDNRKQNLRLCKQANNTCNQQMRSDNTSGYKGVGWRKDMQKWGAHIGFERKPIHLGYFDTPEEAAIAYNAAAIKYHGEYAHLNEI